MRRWQQARRRIGTVAVAAVVIGAGVQCGKQTGADGRDTVGPRARARAVNDRFAAAGVLVERLGDRTFKLRAGPKPPPRVGQSMTLPFPPPEKPRVKPDPAKAPPLKVLRTHPKGRVGMQNAVTVSFNQPMVPLASLSDLRKLPRPLRVSPPVPGQFRWLGTRTLSLESKARIRFSTRYTARVPAGTVAESGRKLDKEVRWQFETPRLAIQAMLPQGSRAVPTSPIAVLFNQRIDVEKVVAATRLLARGQRAVALRAVPRNQWDKLGSVGVTARRWERGRVLVLQPKRPLAKGTRYVLRVRAGLRAGEGPLPTKKPITRTFHTYGPLKVLTFRCGGYRGPCRPKSSKQLRFSNSLKTEGIDRQIQVQPKVPDLNIRCYGSYGSYCYLYGTFLPQTRYRILVRSTLEDVYDQKLGATWKTSFWVGDAHPQLQLPVSGTAAVTEWRGNRRLVVRSVNVKGVTANLVRVRPEHVPFALKVMRKRWHRKYRRFSMAPDIPGTQLSRSLRLNRKRNHWQNTGIPLDLNLPGKKPGILFVELYAPDLKKTSRYANPYRRLLVQVTDLGLTIRYDTDQILALVSGLQSGRGVPQADVTFYSDSGQLLWEGKTGADGLVKAPGARALKHKGPVVVVARHGDDATVAELRGGGQQGYAAGYSSRTSHFPKHQVLRSHLFTERSPFRPGETVHLTGILRVEDNTPTGGIGALRGDNVRIKYWIRDARRRLVVKNRSLPVDADGTFHLDFRIPENASLGQWRFRGQVRGSAMAGSLVYHSFQVLHYRTPEYKVAVKTRGATHYFGDTLEGTIRGRYYYGTAMAGAPVSWTLRRQVGSFRPPRNATFRFGELRDWTWRWRRHHGWRGGRYGSYYTSGQQSGGILAKGKGSLDAKGALAMRAKLPFWKKGYGPGTVGAFTLEAQVFDKNRQAIAGRKVLTVHPAAVYVGLRMKKRLIRAGKDTTVQVVVTDHGGKRQAGHRVKVVATSQVTTRKAKKVEGRWVYDYGLQEKVVGGCSVTTSTEIQGCQLRLPKAGYYRLRAEARDTKGRRTRTVIGVYAVGKRYVPWKQDNESRLELIPDRKKYRPGDTARLLIKSPFRRALGLLTVERKGIRTHRLVHLDSSVHVERIRLLPTDLPNVHVTVALVRGRVPVPGAPAGTDLGRPRFAQGTANLRVSIAEKELQVKVRAARDTARPGAKTTIHVSVKDHAGRPTRARLAVMLVDEGVLSLLGFRVADPATVFHSPKAARAALRDLRADLIKQDRRFTKPRVQRNRRLTGGYLYRRGAVRRPSPSKARDLVLLRQRVTVATGSAGGRAVAESKKESADEDRGGRPGAPPPPVDAPPAGPTTPTLSFKTRALFASTAFFKADVVTDRSGRAEVPVTLPENLTTFRITAVALDRDHADRFGAGEGRVTVKRPLMLMPALPRFANYGDRFEAAVKVTNETGAEGTATVRIQMTNAKPVGPVTRTVALAKGQTEEVRFPVIIGAPGRARFRFLAYLGQETDAVEVAIPVNLPATTEAFATYGVTDSSMAQTVLPPKDALTSFGGLEMSFSSTALTGMEDAVRYLVDYPWECTEQTASRVIPLFALRRILPAFHLLGQKTEEGDQYVVKIPERFLAKHKGRSRAEIERKYLEWLATSGIAKLVSYQRYDGGYGYWGGSRRTWPYPTAWALFALLRAKEAGYSVPDRTVSRAASWLSNFLNNRYRWRHYPWVYAWTMRAMAAWILSELKDSDAVSFYTRRRFRLASNLNSIHSHRGKLPLFAKAMLMQALYRLEGRTARVSELLREFDNAAIQDTPYKVHFREVADESLRLLMHSTSRTDSIVLAALMEVQPDYPLVAKVVKGLIEARVRGRWETTQANAFALLALSRYYKHYEKVVPDYRLRAWLGSGFIGETRFQGRSMRVVEAKVPMAYLKAQGRKALLLSKKGAGKVYYRLGLRYAPKSLRLGPEEQGFAVSREYEPVQSPGDVTRAADGSWTLKAGRYVRVRLRIVVPSRRYFVAVDDPLPAGLEAVDLKLKTSASSALSGKAKNKIFDFHSYYAFFAFSHREKRDDRVVLFSDRLPSGVYEYTYLARATTIGSFVVPPLKAEEMYHPEVFGRNGTQFVRVVP